MSDFQLTTQAYDKCPKCGGFVDTTGGPQSGRLCVQCAHAELTRLPAREAELVEALELILPLAKGYNAIQAGAPRGCPESNRRYVECAEAALARVRTEKGETT